MEKPDAKLIVSSNTESALDLAATIGSAVPWIGGPISNVLGGMSLGRKLGRIRTVLGGLAEDIKDIESQISKDYVKSEEFEDLLEQTLKRVAEERHSEKRELYRSFLANAVESPGEAYDDQLRILRTLERIGPDDIRVIRALRAEPAQEAAMTGSPIATLQRRLPELDKLRIVEVTGHLSDLGIATPPNLHTMMTGTGAEDLRHFFTDFGLRLIKYVERSSEKPFS